MADGAATLDDGYLSVLCNHFGVIPATLGEEANDAAADEADAEVCRPAPLGSPMPAIKIDVLQQVESAQSDADCAEAREMLREALEGELLYEHYEQYCDDATLRRFLTARGNDVQKAKKLLLGALEWRDERLSCGFDFQELEQEARFGAMRVSGLDRYGRPLVVFDYPAGLTAQQTRDCQSRNCTPDMQNHGVDLKMRFLSYNLEHAVRRMEGTSTEKYVVFLHLGNFSISTAPPWALVTDALDMLSRCYPERVGNVVFHDVGMFFSRMFSMAKPFIDPKTAKKFIFIEGDDSPGTQNDSTLREVIGARWRELTGVGMPRESPQSSPGYKHKRDWRKMLSYELAWYRQDQKSGSQTRSRRRLNSEASLSSGSASRPASLAKETSPQSTLARPVVFVVWIFAFIFKCIFKWFPALLWWPLWHVSASTRHLCCNGGRRTKFKLEDDQGDEEGDEDELAGVDMMAPDGLSSELTVEIDPELQNLKELAREMIDRDRLTLDTRAASLDAALKFVDAIVRGLQSAGLLQSVTTHPPAAGKDGPSIHVTTCAPTVGEIATRSRVPMEVCVPKRTVHFSLSLRPPPQACPFRCSCHTRCVGVAPGELEGWGELTLDVDNERVQLHTMTPVVWSEESDLDALGDVEVALFDLNAAMRAAAGRPDDNVGIQASCLGSRDFATIEQVRGKVALTQYGGRLPSKQLIINAAHAAGAVAVIGHHVSERGRPALERALFTDPVPMVVVPREDGLKLAAALRNRKRVTCRGIRNASLGHDRARRRRLADSRRCPHEEVWLHIDGLVGRPLEGDSLLWEAVGQDPSRFAPEDLWGVWRRLKHNWLLGYKWARMIESVSGMAQFFPQAQVHKGLGNILTDFMLVCEHDISWLRFQPFAENGPDNPARTDGIGVYGGLRPRAETATGNQMDRARAHCYHGSLICHAPGGIATGKRVSPSTTAFLQCFRGEAAGVPPADFNVILKVFTACVGPVAAPSGRPWQRMDRTWHITDYRNALGRVVAKQGRLLWESEVAKSARVDAADSNSFWAAPRRDCSWGCGL